MKRISSIFILFVLSIAFVACGDNDDEPKRDWPATITDSHLYTIEVLVSAGAEINIPLEVSLEDFSKLNNLKDKVSTAEANADSFIKITGVTAGNHNFESLTLKVEGTNIQRVFKNVTEDDTFQSVKTDLTFLDKVAERVGKHKTAVIRLQGTSEKEINKTVKVQINLNAVFKMK